MLSWFRKTRQSKPTRTSQRCATIDRLEGRVYFAHLGHEVVLPPAAIEHGQRGLARVQETYTFANHRRARLLQNPT